MTDEQAARAPEDETVRPVGEPIGIANEFTGVRVQKVRTRNGERLEVTTPKHGHRVLLDAMQLEIISTLTPEAFTELIARRLGSHEGHDRGDAR
ncbi:hypothetical protein DMP23_44105 [Amycolatopsis sp. A1MSW2902]|uniref:hypothetical protein n=1 Tax=Amycolatopsis sp. A1MSW2902 TaxID=687413 RepID=UPI00307DF7C8